MNESAGQSRVLTLVFTDLADSTALKTARGDQAVHDLIEAHREHVTRLAAECSGRIIDWAGDGCFLTFETSSAGAMFALRLQQVHHENPDLPGVRTGLHMGEVSESPGPGEAPRIDGLAVDVAARISGLAKPGQVLMSAAVYNSARQRLGVEAFGQPVLWQTHGTYELKGFDEHLVIGEAGIEGIAHIEAPRASEKARLVQRAKRKKGESSFAPRDRRGVPIWAIGVFAVLVLIIGVLLGRQQSASKNDSAASPVVDTTDIGPITSLAVLPLSNLMNDPEQDYFVDGMMEAITAELSKISSLKVISRTTAMHYKHTELSIPEIADELGVQGLIEGSVLRQGNEVRITVQLIDAPADTHLWANSYPGTLDDIFRLHSDVALAIAEEIRVAISPEEQSLIASTPKVDPEAYELYLRGLETFFDGSVAGSMRAIRYFEDALEIEPDFGLAWARKSMAHIAIRVWAPPTFAVQTPLAKQASKRAIALSPDDAIAYIGQFHMELTSLDWYSAKATVDRAYELNPNLAEINVDLGILEACRGDFAEAERYLERAYELDPRSTFVAPVVGLWSATIGKRARSIQILERFIVDNSDFALAQIFYFYVSVGGANNDEALEALKHFDRLTGARGFTDIHRAINLARRGRLEEARALHRDVLSHGALSTAPLSTVAAYHASVGEFDKAFDYLAMAFEAPDINLINVFRMSPFVPGGHMRLSDEITKDDRYWELTDRMKFPPFPEGHPGYEAQQRWELKKAAAEEANAPIRKIAVLPFENMMRDPEQEYFVDGMTEALITELAQIKSLQVRGRTTVMRFKDTDKSIQEIARELDVDGIIEGSVMREGDEVRITAQLIHGPSDVHRWAGSFVSTVTSIFKLHSDMALRIAREVRANVTPQEESLLAEAAEVDKEAFEQVLMGRFAMYQLSPEGFAEGAAFARRAIELSPEYADAHSLLATALWSPTAWGWGDPNPVMDEVREAVRRGLELDPRNVNLLINAALIALSFDRDWVEAERNFVRAIDSNPQVADAHAWMSWLYAVRGDYEASIASAQRGVDLEPYNPGALDLLEDAYALAGRHEDAVELGERALRVDPDNEGNLMNLMWRHADLGREAEFRRDWNRITALGESVTRRNRSTFAIGLVTLGLFDESRKVIDRVLEDPQVYLDPGVLAVCYAGLGEKEKMYEMLDAAYERRGSFLILTIGTKWSRLFDPYRDEARFQAILEKMNFPKREDTN